MTRDDLVEVLLEACLALDDRRDRQHPLSVLDGHAGVVERFDRAVHDRRMTSVAVTPGSNVYVAGKSQPSRLSAGTP